MKKLQTYSQKVIYVPKKDLFSILVNEDDPWASDNDLESKSPVTVTQTSSSPYRKKETLNNLGCLVQDDLSDKSGRWFLPGGRSKKVVEISFMEKSLTQNIMPQRTKYVSTRKKTKKKYKDSRGELEIFISPSIIKKKKAKKQCEKKNVSKNIIQNENKLHSSYSIDFDDVFKHSLLLDKPVHHCDIENVRDQQKQFSKEVFSGTAEIYVKDHKVIASPSDGMKSKNDENVNCCVNVPGIRKKKSVERSVGLPKNYKHIYDNDKINSPSQKKTDIVKHTNYLEEKNLNQPRVLNNSNCLENSRVQQKDRNPLSDITAKVCVKNATKEVCCTQHNFHKGKIACDKKNKCNKKKQCSNLTLNKMLVKKKCRKINQKLQRTNIHSDSFSAKQLKCSTPINAVSLTNPYFKQNTIINLSSIKPVKTRQMTSIQNVDLTVSRYTNKKIAQVSKKLFGLQTNNDTLLANPRKALTFVQHTNNQNKTGRNSSVSHLRLQKSCSSSVLLSETFQHNDHQVKITRSFLRSLAINAEAGVQEILQFCQPTRIIQFSEAYLWNSLSCHKIGEGSYGEVFSITSEKEPVRVLKIMPLRIYSSQNNEFASCKDAEHEIIICRQLTELKSGTSNKCNNFIKMNKVCCVKGRYPFKLLREWNKFKRSFKNSTFNEHPRKYRDAQIFVIFEFEYGGKPLEDVKVRTAGKIISVFKQIAGALAVAEEQCSFEHRDLHLQNILISSTKNKHIECTLDSRKFKIPSEGILVKIIDFTISRLITETGNIIFTDIKDNDPFLQQKGDRQYDIYRSTHSFLKGNWSNYCPYTNVLWLHYVLENVLNSYSVRHQSSTEKIHLSYLRDILKNILNFASVKEFAEKVLFAS